MGRAAVVLIFTHKRRLDWSEEVALRDELEFIRLYLEIERMRLGEAGPEVEYRIEPEALDALVPHLILQPLVESAVRPGVTPCAPGGRLPRRLVVTQALRSAHGAAAAAIWAPLSSTASPRACSGDM